MPLQATSGAASYDAFGGGVAAVPNYIEDVFSTYLYTGNGSTRTITNNIDLSTFGGMVWSKDRSAAQLGFIQDTARTGATSALIPSLTGGGGYSNALDSYTTSGYVISGTGNGPSINPSGDSCVSWTFRKQPKFFDVVTYTGNGIAGRQIAHNLGSTPGCIIVKATSNTAEGLVYHQSLGNTKYLTLFSAANGTAAADTWTEAWNNTSPTSTHFTVGSGSNSNADGWTFVAYLFAHNAGGFGLTGTDNVISCGSFTTDGSGNATVDLGYEPQWVLVKSSINASSWIILDTMRGWNQSSNDRGLAPNSSGAESTFSGQYGTPTATGFTVASNFGTSDTNIYIAIRRGPMKVPTSGTSVFAPVAYTGDGGSPKAINAGFVADAAWGRGRTDTFNWNQVDRLRGSPRLSSNATSAEATSVYGNPTWDTMTGLNGVNGGTDNSNYNQSSMGYIFDVFKRAPSFFDVVCYTGNGSTQNITHNLGVAPELMIVKMRSATSATGWIVYAAPLASAATSYLVLNLTDAVGTDNTVLWNSTAPTSSVFSLGASSNINTNGATNVAYLFASCAGVSKCGTFTGNGSSQTINCGFTGGARFVMIKATSTTGNWIVADSARGIVAGNDPALYLNSTAAEVTGLDWIDADNSGFVVNETATIAANTNGVSYIFFAVA